MDQSDIVGPSEMLVPGSQQFLLLLAALLGIVALVGLVVTVALLWRRRGRGAPGRRPVWSVVWVTVLAAALVLGLVNRPPAFFVPEFPALPRLFPESSFFYRPVTDLSVAAGSEQMVAALGDQPIDAGASGEVISGVVWGNPFNIVDDSTPRHRVSMTYPAGSDDVDYPITEPAYLQSMPSQGIDDHYIGIDLERRQMWELWAVRNWFGRWQAGSGALWDLDSMLFPRGGTTATGLPMMPLTYTYAEVDSGTIHHVLGMAVSAGSPSFVWPARGSDGPSSDPDAPPMGSWLRLRRDVDTGALGPQARVIAQAMRDYGMVITDTTSGVGLSGTPDARWDNEDLATLRSLSTDDLQFVDASGLMVDRDSMEAAPFPLGP